MAWMLCGWKWLRYPIISFRPAALHAAIIASHSAVRALSWLIRRAIEHPNAIDRLDASARTLWPDIPESAAYAERGAAGSEVWPVLRREAAGT